MGDQPTGSRQERIWFWGLLALAVLLRAFAFDPYAMHHPDEVLQYVEPAYRLLSADEKERPSQGSFGFRLNDARVQVTFISEALTTS